MVLWASLYTVLGQPIFRNIPYSAFLFLMAEKCLKLEVLVVNILVYKEQIAF